jgi:hypothetical protein
LLLDMNFDDIELNTTDTLLLDMIFDDDDDDEDRDHDSILSGNVGISPDTLLLDMKFDNDDLPSPDTLLLDMNFDGIQTNTPDTLLLDMDFDDDDDDSVSSEDASIAGKEATRMPERSMPYLPRMAQVTSVVPTVLGTCPVTMHAEAAQCRAQVAPLLGATVGRGPLAFATVGNTSQQSPVHGCGPVLAGTSPATSPCSVGGKTMFDASQRNSIGSSSTCPATMGPILVGTCPVTNNGCASQLSTAATATAGFGPSTVCGSALANACLHTSIPEQTPVWNAYPASPIHGDYALKSWLCGESGRLPCSAEIAARLLAAAPEAYED